LTRNHGLTLTIAAGRPAGCSLQFTLHFSFCPKHKMLAGVNKIIEVIR